MNINTYKCAKLQLKPMFWLESASSVLYYLPFIFGKLKKKWKLKKAETMFSPVTLVLEVERLGR